MTPPLKVPSHWDVRSWPLEVRAVTNDAGKKVVTGYGAVFDSPSQPLMTESGMEFLEIVAPGTFARSIAEADVRSCFNHDNAMLLGRRAAGTLRVWEDSRGLGYEVTLGNRSYDRDLMESLERGDVSGSSFTFATVRDDWAEGPKGMALRTLREAHLFELGPVVFPAYRSATATIRGLNHFVEARSAAAAPPPEAQPFNGGDLRARLDRLNLMGRFLSL